MRHLVALLGFSLLHAETLTPDQLIENQHGKRARAFAEAKLAAAPNDVESLYLMSWVKQAMGDPAAATQLAEKAVAAAPNVAKYHLRLAEAVGEQAQKAGALKQIGLGRRFKKEIDATVALDPRQTSALNHLMQFYLQAPGILGGDKKKAREIPAQIAAVDPVKGAMAEVALARYDKENDKIEGLCRKAFEARPQNYDARITLGGFLLNKDLKNASEAEKHARESLKLDPTRIGAHGLLALSLAVQERWTEVDAVLAQAEKDVPDNLSPYLRVANWCVQRSVELPRAERYVRRYLSQEPELGFSSWSVGHWRLGAVFEKMGRKTEAVAEYQTAVKMDANSPAKEALKKLKG